MQTRDLLETIQERALSARDAAAKLEKYKESELYYILTTRVSGDDFSELQKFDLPINKDDFPRSPRLRRLGKRLYLRWSRTLYTFACEDKEGDKDIRDELMKALRLKEDGGTALIAGILVSAFGVAPAVAVVIAVLIAKLIIRPAGDAICETWKEALGKNIA